MSAVKISKKIKKSFFLNADMESVHWVDVECPLTIYPNPKPINLNPKSCFKTEMDDAHWVDVECPPGGILVTVGQGWFQVLRV